MSHITRFRKIIGSTFLVMVEEFLNEVIRPMLAANADCIGQKAELNV